MSFEDQLRASGLRNRELLQVLDRTDHAIPDLKQQQVYVDSLEQQLSETNKRIDSLEKRHKQDLKDHVKYKDSVVRRFAYKATGQREKFNERASKEEKDYFDGLREGQQAQDSKRQLEGLLQEAKVVQNGLQAEVGQHQQAQSELDALYDSIFSGPTPSYPEEDERERQAEHTLQTYHDIRTRFESEQHASKMLGQASQRLRGALGSMSNALSHSQWDMFGGGTINDMMERNELSNADRQLSAALVLVAQAQRSSPYVRDLPPVNVAAGSLMSDVFFDNIFTDMAFHDKIKQSDREMRVCEAALRAQLSESLQRLHAMETELKLAGDRLEQARVVLQTTRAAAFERLRQG